MCYFSEIESTLRDERLVIIYFEFFWNVENSSMINFALSGKRSMIISPLQTQKWISRISSIKLFLIALLVIMSLVK